MTVDAHVHLLPIRLGRAIRDFFADHGVDPRSWRYPIDHEAVVAALASEGVDTAWSLPYARRPGSADGLNEASAATVAWAGDGPVAVVGGATVHPGDHDPAGTVRRAVEDLGLRVLKLHCSVGDYRPDDPRLDEVWEWVSTVRLPVVIHAGHAVSGHTSGDELVPVGAVAERWPEARIIIAHCGHHAVDAALDLLERHPAVHADLTPVVFDPVPLPPARAVALSGRLLFGSDCPNTATTITEALAGLDRLGLSPDALAGVTAGNARRLQAEIRV